MELRSALVGALFVVACHPDASADPPASKPSDARTSVTPSAGWWKARTKKFDGKTAGGAKFTIELPSSVEQATPPASATFTARGPDGELKASLTVLTMVEFAQHMKTYPEFKREFIRAKAEVLHEEQADQGFAVLFRDEPSADYVSATIVNKVGDTQSMCSWELPTSAVKDKAAFAWDVMKKACRSITLSW